MDLPRFSSTVRRVTILNRDETGRMVPVVLFDKGGKKRKKGTQALRPFERLARRLVEANNAAAADYLAGHRKSNRKRRDGWVRDVNVNVFDAGRKAWKKLNPGSILDF